MGDEKRDIWLLWQIVIKDGGQQYLLAVDESEELVVRHKKMLLGQYEGEWATKSGPLPRLHVEKRETNHCYGERGL